MSIKKTAARVGGWLVARARERTTWIGLAAIAGAAGKSVLADHLTSAGNLVPMVLGIGGGALVAHVNATVGEPEFAEPE